MEANRSERVNSLGSALTGSAGGFGSNWVEDVLARSRVAAMLDFARRVGDAVVAVLRADLMG